MANKIKVLCSYLKYKNKKFKSRLDVEEYQQKVLKKHLKFVTRKSDFYSEYTDKKLDEFPIINKKIMMDNFNKLNTVGIDKEEALEFAIKAEKERSFKPKIGRITIGLSSGTSNTRGVFILSDDEISKWAGFILSRFLSNGLLKAHKIAFFMRANSNLYESVNSGKIEFEFFDIYKPMNDNIKKLNELKPDIIVGQPSVLKEICDSVEKNAIQIKPEKIISIAEVLESSDEQIIKKTFKVNHIDQVYQCTEGCLATTCRFGKIHLNEDIVHIEKEYLDDERFIPIITDFSRTSQPIIRYRLNDILVEDKKMCECGSFFTVIKKIEGREDDVFKFKGINNEVVKIFPDFIRRCIMFSGDIDSYRVVQDENGNLNIYIDCNGELRQRIIDSFIALAEDNKFKLPTISFESYSYDKKRKLKRVESLCK